GVVCGREGRGRRRRRGGGGAGGAGADMSGWNLDAYGAMLDAAARRYGCVHFDHEPRPGEIFLRHDVDLSLAAAVRLAELEAERDVTATYFLMTRSVFYNLASEEGERTLEHLRALGPRVGLHAAPPHIDFDARFDAVLAWHNPDPEFMNEPVDGLVNVMSTPWFDRSHYRSDSNQHWRSGDPTAALA